MDSRKDSEDLEADKSETKKVVEVRPVEDVPDGGLLAWIIVLASFLTNGIIFGIHNCYGIIYLRLRNELESSGISDAATKACNLPNLRFSFTFTFKT